MNRKKCLNELHNELAPSVVIEGITGDGKIVRQVEKIQVK